MRLEDVLDDLFAPLQRAVRGNARTFALELRGNRENVDAIFASRLHGQRGPGGRMRVGYDEQLERLQAVEGFRNARDAVAGMSLHEPRPPIVFLRDLIFR